MTHLAPANPDPRQLAAGRGLPRLLFVTDRVALDDNIGAHGATEILDLIREANHARPRHERHVILEYLGPRPTRRATALAEVHAALREANVLGTVHGVVLLGGYDVVPTMRFDCLPPALRTFVDEKPFDGNDADDFVVWCDDPYGDPDDTGIPEVPVSRIPDGRSKTLMLNALRAPVATTVGRSGVRNVERPFAETVFNLLPGDGEMVVSAPRHAANLARTELRTSHVYLVLHGRHDIGKFLWGERSGRHVTADAPAESAGGEPALTPGERAALALDDAAKPREITDTMEFAKIEHEAAMMVTAVACDHMPGEGAVILSGGCWSASSAATSARRWRKAYAPKPRRAGTSVALAALNEGARAFVGSTGVNYSPLGPNDRFYCEPLHREFWQHVTAGHAPARALLYAKHRYASGMPHGRGNDFISLAIEHKTLHQYTCLGLGW
jgi:hypothetical protein